jgi:hypothetical protein
MASSFSVRLVVIVFGDFRTNSGTAVDLLRFLEQLAHSVGWFVIIGRWRRIRLEFRSDVVGQRIENDSTVTERFSKMAVGDSTA